MTTEEMQKKYDEMKIRYQKKKESRRLNLEICEEICASLNLECAKEKKEKRKMSAKTVAEMHLINALNLPSVNIRTAEQEGELNKWQSKKEIVWLHKLGQDDEQMKFRITSQFARDLEMLRRRDDQRNKKDKEKVQKNKKKDDHETNDDKHEESGGLTPDSTEDAIDAIESAHRGHLHNHSLLRLRIGVLQAITEVSSNGASSDDESWVLASDAGSWVLPEL